MTGDSQRPPAPRLGAPAGLCAECMYLEIVSGERSAFVRCGLARHDSTFPRYPRLPVTDCGGFSRRLRDAEAAR